MFQDPRFGWRILRANKTLALVAALSMGLGIRLRAGRELDWNNVSLYGKAAAEPAIINQAFAHKYFPDGNPVGERLISGLGGGAKQIEIIGVSVNISFVNSLGEEPAPLIQPLSNLRHSFIVRVAGSPAVAAP